MIYKVFPSELGDPADRVWLRATGEVRCLEMPYAHARAIEAVVPHLFEVRNQSNDPITADDALRYVSGRGATPVSLHAPAWLATVVWEVRQALLLLPRTPARSAWSGTKSPREHAPTILTSLLGVCAPSPLLDPDDTTPPTEALEALYRLGGATAMRALLQPAISKLLDDVHWQSGALAPRKPMPPLGEDIPPYDITAGELPDLPPRVPNDRPRRS